MEVVIVEWEGAVLGLNFGRSIVTNEDFAAYSIVVRKRRAFPKLLWGGLVIISCHQMQLVRRAQLCT